MQIELLSILPICSYWSKFIFNEEKKSFSPKVWNIYNRIKLTYNIIEMRNMLVLQYTKCED